MYQFFVEPGQITGNLITITGNDVNHIKNVLRMKIGEELSVVNGVDGKDYRCGILEFLQDSVSCQLRAVNEDGLELSSRVYLFQGLPKSDKMELIIQKAVELGVYEIIPVSAKRCVVKLDNKKEKNKIDRWQQISEAAAKQSKRRIVPKITEVMSMKEALSYCREFEIKIIPYELAEGMQETKTIFDNLHTGQSIAVFIGPEGGFEDSEIQEATKNNVVPITLGKRILRTETAGFTVLAWIMYQLEN